MFNQPNHYFQNPVLSGFYPDPSVTRVGEDYYLVTSSFEYFPGVPIFHSRDLVNWQQIGHCLERASQIPLALIAPDDNVFANTVGFSAGIWAPTLRHDGQQFVMVTTNVSVGKHFYVTTLNPDEGWSEPIWVDDVPEIGSSIDPSLFFDDDGKVYFTCNGTQPGGIYQFEIDLETGKRLSEIRRICDGFLGKGTEGPHLYKVNGWYYLLTAEGGTEYGHLIAVGRSLSAWGPFEPSPHNPVLTHRSIDSSIQCTGHGDLFQAHDGSWWIVFLGVRPNGYPPTYHLGRETFLAPVTWTSDGWFVVGNNGRVDVQMPAPSFYLGLSPKGSQRDDFDTMQLGLDWNFLRNPINASWSLTKRTGWLRLNGSTDKSLDNRLESPCFIGQRQRHFDCCIETMVELIEGDGEAGITVFMNEQHHYEIALSCEGQQFAVIVRRRVGRLSSMTACVPFVSGSVQLGIVADRNTYTLYFYSNGKRQVLDVGETRYLSTEVAGGFIGVYCGLYATTTADFDWFDYQSL